MAVRYGFVLMHVMHLGLVMVVPGRHLYHLFPVVADVLLDNPATMFGVLHFLEVDVNLLVSLAVALHARDQNLSVNLV